MSYIARTNGGNTVIEIRQGSLNDIISDDRENWREVQRMNFPIDNFFQIRTTTYFTVSEDGTVVNMYWNVENVDPLLLKERLKEYAAEVRWNKQVGGISLPNGMRILTDEESQTKIHQVYSILKEGWAEEINFKTPSGWATVNLSDMTAISQAVFSHIQNCFNQEKSIIDAIDSGTVTTVDQIINWNW